MTSPARTDYPAILCRGCSSRIVRIQNRLPFSVWSSTKSRLHTSRGRLARTRCAVEVPSCLMRRCFLLTSKAFMPQQRRDAPVTVTRMARAEFQHLLTDALVFHAGRCPSGKNRSEPTQPHDKPPPCSPCRFPRSVGQAAFLQTGSPFFCVNFLQNAVLYAEVGNDALEPRVLILQRPQTPSLAHVHFPILVLPRVVGSLADDVRGTDRTGAAASPDLSQDPDNLLFAESTFFIGSAPSKGAELHFSTVLFQGVRPPAAEDVSQIARQGFLVVAPACGYFAFPSQQTRFAKGSN